MPGPVGVGVGIGVEDNAVSFGHERPGVCAAGRIDTDPETDTDPE